MRALNALLMHPKIAGIRRKVVAGGAGADHDHATALYDEDRDGEGAFARMLEHEIDIVAFAGVLPDRRSEFADLLEPLAIFRGAHLRQLAPTLEIFAIDRALCAQLHDKAALILLGDNPNGVGTGRCAKLHGKGAKPAGSAPDEHVVAGAKDMRAVAEQHPVSGRHGQRVAGAFLPAQMARPRHELAVLDTGELRERAVWGLIAPNALGRREHRIAAIAFLVVAVVLVAVHHDLVANLPALDLGANCPDDAGRVRACNVIGLLVAIERGDRRAERSPKPIIVNAGGHGEEQHVVAIELPGGYDLQLHGLIGRAMPLFPDGPCIHFRRHMAERGNFADLIEIFRPARPWLLKSDNLAHGFTPCHTLQSAWSVCS